MFKQYTIFQLLSNSHPDTQSSDQSTQMPKKANIVSTGTFPSFINDNKGAKAFESALVNPSAGFV